jgi:methionyl-tRNA formyltransferase
MNIALFAADEVGREVVEFFREQQVKPTVLFLDARDPKKLNATIRTITNAPTVLDSNALAEETTLAMLRAARLDLIILAWWPYILKTPLIQIPRIGCLNFHPSLLPYNRGKHPNFWSLVEETPYGVSLHFIDAGIDSGDIVFQRPIAKGWEDTGKTLHDRARREIVNLFKENFPAILRGEIPRRRQDAAQGSYHRGSELEPTSVIDLDKTYSLRYLLNLLRARTFPPHPAVRFEDGGEKFEVRVEIRKVIHE